MKRWFSPALVPYVAHPMVTDLGAEAVSGLLRRALVRELVRIRLLELRILAPLARQLARGEAPGEYGDGARRGERLARDAEWHARQVDVLIASLGLGDDGQPPAFAVRLERLLSVHAADDTEVVLLTMLFAGVAATAGPQVGVTLASDPELHPDVREFFRGRVRDEDWHSRFFGRRLRELWPQLGRRRRDRLGPLLPALIQVILEPDRAAALGDLASAGLQGQQAAEVLATSWPRDDEWAAADVIGAAAPAVRCLELAGALEHPPTLLAFVEAGLLRV